MASSALGRGRGKGAVAAKLETYRDMDLRKRNINTFPKQCRLGNVQRNRDDGELGVTMTFN